MARHAALPTQVAHPWRATARTAFQVLLALALLAPLVVQTALPDAQSLPAWVAGFLAVCAGVTRVMALPQVEAFLERFLPWLAAEKPPTALTAAPTAGGGSL